MSIRSSRSPRMSSGSRKRSSPTSSPTASVQDQPPSSTNLASLFECPVCYNHALPPIYQCQSGHLVCSECRPKVSACPSCRGPLSGNIRNLAMEKVAQTVYFPCKHANAGCTSHLPHNRKISHEETCDFRPYTCPCPGAGCKWTGYLESVINHLMSCHKSITTLSGEDIVFLATDINLPGAVDWVMMQSCFGQHFMLILEKQDRGNGVYHYYAAVQLIGPKCICERFSYRLELTTPRPRKRRMIWEAPPRSIHEGINGVINKSDCLSFDTVTAQRFSENGNLGINVTINQVPWP